VQVRGAGKAEAPGCFDLPTAGHVTGLEEIEEAFFKELRQELSLKRGDLHELWLLGAYAYDPPPDPSGLRNAEYRVVFRTQLDAASRSRLSVPSDEVAAITALSLAELEGLIAGFPDRVASGLRASFPLYLRDRTQASALSEGQSPAYL